jgi:hypothetical protein
MAEALRQLVGRRQRQICNEGYFSRILNLKLVGLTGNIRASESRGGEKVKGGLYDPRIEG